MSAQDATAKSWSLAELAAVLQLSVRGDGCTLITGVASLESAGSGDLAFYQDPRLAAQLHGTRAAAVLLRPDHAATWAGNALLSPQPYASFVQAVHQLFPVPALAPGLSPTAQVHPDASVDPQARVEDFAVVEAGAEIAAGVVLGPGVWVGAGAVVGAGSRLYAGVKVYPGCRIGQDCILHANAVIGADGFGFVPSPQGYLKIPHLGRVVLGNSVEIGANTCIDRGMLDDTIISAGVKIDNLVQIGHNVHIGEGTVIAGQTGIAGSTKIGARCQIGGQVGFAGHLQITEGCRIAGQSAITHDLREAGVYSGVLPAREARRWRRLAARFDQMDSWVRRLRQLESAAPISSPSDEESTN